jgi:DMSO/TMAO reductase YedYZ molybdopterin-dependent catalytic subunit
VMIAYAMNGLPLPLLNGFPLRLVVPGWFATYWVKMLDTIEVLDRPDDNFWMAKAYLIPDTPHADIKPGAKGVKMVPINRMLPRSFITNLAPGARLAVGAPQLVRGIAFGGDAGVARVDFSSDGGKTWVAAQLGEDTGKYGFRRWEARVTAAAPGDVRLAVRCTNTQGDAQPDTANWNPGGYMRNVVETVVLTAA